MRKGVPGQVRKARNHLGVQGQPPRGGGVHRDISSKYPDTRWPHGRQVGPAAEGSCVLCRVVVRVPDSKLWRAQTSRAKAFISGNRPPADGHSYQLHNWVVGFLCVPHPTRELLGGWPCLTCTTAAPEPGAGGQSPQMSAPRLIAAAAADKGPVYSGHLVWAAPSAGPGETAERTPVAVTALRPHPSETDGNPVTREKFPGIKIRRSVSGS
ncbi:uncharacterized protein LOC125148304 [Prionailurus viverrinus]|uniref:uncharacterized protein LOC125148304 n=1 Tax=Prionailurus viverrinus TaxID=61388 RepID=UPI001FF35237|nr:uncharacterized protein LOC125148304 [Prionailurus viverrinus]